MFGWLRQKVADAATGVQEREMAAWIANLSQMDSDEVGFVLAVATHFRHFIEKRRGIDLLDPIVTYSRDPTLAMYIHGLIQSAQKHGPTMDSPMSQAAGAMVWLFTMRAGANIALRGLGRQLWKELSRGIPKVEDATMNYYMVSRQALDIDDYERIPIGLDPTPR